MPIYKITKKLNINIVTNPVYLAIIHEALQLTPEPLISYYTRFPSFSVTEREPWAHCKLIVIYKDVTLSFLEDHIYVQHRRTKANKTIDYSQYTSIEELCTTTTLHITK